MTGVITVSPEGVLVLNPADAAISGDGRPQVRALAGDLGGTWSVPATSRPAKVCLRLGEITQIH